MTTNTTANQIKASNADARTWAIAQLQSVIDAETAKRQANAKAHVISTLIKAEIDDGKTIKEAMKIVLPACDIDAMIGEIYDDLRADAKMEAAS